MKAYQKIVTTCIIAASANAWAGIVVNGDFSAAPTAQTAVPITSAQLDTGWIGTSGVQRSFNAVTTSSGGNKGMFLNQSTSGNNGGFALSNDGTRANVGTLWNLFSFDNLATTGFTIDVAALTTYQTNSGATQLTTGAAVGNAVNVAYAIYGFNGTFVELTTAMATANFSVNGNTLATPSSTFTTIDTGSLLTVGSLDTWETQTFNFAKGNYDYLLFGLSTTGGSFASAGIGVDNVVAIVPEPSTYIAFAGFAGLVFFVWRRRNVAKKATAKA